MRLYNCTRCGALYASHSGQGLCPACLKQDQADFEKVRDYLKEHPRAPLLEVSQATGVPLPRIREYVRQGRLVMGEPGAEGLDCERCGRPIVTGRLCDRCARSLALQLRSTTEKARDKGKSPSSPAAAKGKVYLADRVREHREERREG